MALSRPKRYKIALAGNLAYGLSKLWFSTCRIRILQPDLHQKCLTGAPPSIGATWHRGAIFYCYFYGPVHPMVMFSQSEDGEYLARFAQKCGTIPVRGSSSRGGGQALRRMAHFLRQGKGHCSTVLDGPQGPRFKAKKGLLLLAKLTGAPLIPTMWSASRVITLESTWDKTIIPRPFSEIVIGHGQPYYIPRDCSDDQLEDYRLEVENLLNNLMREVDGLCGYRTRWINP
jgi:lysophospholipid acyltransferase (LPLAT)-like uncharacterized protein